jgi:PadR family transcriptional regulator, regulatory protein AphA
MRLTALRWAGYHGRLPAQDGRMLKRLSTTSFAVLGLLALRPWTTYELAQEMQRSLRQVWPRAESGLYEEPKMLVARGLARAKRDMVGRRPRTTYSITAKGRREVSRWLREEAEGMYPQTESEALLKVLFAEQGCKDDLLVTLASIRREADARRQWLATVASEISTAQGPWPFPRRAHVNFLYVSFLIEQSAAIARWAKSAERQARSWPDDISHAPGKDFAAKLRALARQASQT